MKDAESAFPYVDGTFVFDEFILKNRIRVNRYLNTILWAFVVTGPAIALGIKGGVFPDITYTTCVVISAAVCVMASIHLILLRKFPGSVVTSIAALLSLNILLVYMACSHVSIFLTWFLVPLLSLLFCDRRIYIFALVVNYAMMFMSTWLVSPHYAGLRADADTAFAYFVNTFGGFTIETVIMLISGLMISKITVDNFRDMFEQHKVIKKHESEMKEELEILDSMAEIYDNVNLISFVDNTEMSLRSAEKQKISIDMQAQTHTQMNQKLKLRVMPDQLDDFLKFTDIRTVRARLTGKKIISADFIDVVKGWFRAQYITVDSTSDRIPNTVIYTTRNVDEEKRREEHLIRLSLTDEMTRLYNRRCYDEDLEEYKLKGLGDGFVLFSVDVNGLKKVNDQKGHAAGDELIKGAADCLALAVRNKGKVYRTGGDEFIAIVHTDEPEAIFSEIRSHAGAWHGVYSDTMTMSVGYASKKDEPDAEIDELERIADARMYEDKERYYRENGIDRRR